MKKLLLKVVSATALAACASACGFVGQQLADKAGEERLLKPGALDASLTGVRDTYQFKFLDKLRVSHDWPRNSNGCAYRARPTLDVRNGFSGEFRRFLSNSRQITQNAENPHNRHILTGISK